MSRIAADRSVLTEMAERYGKHALDWRRGGRKLDARMALAIRRDLDTIEMMLEALADAEAEEVEAGS